MSKTVICFYCDKPCKGFFADCVVCEEGPYCSACLIQCPCGQGTPHYLHGFSDRYSNNLFECAHVCLYYDEDGTACNEPICNTGKLKCVLCVADCSADTRFCAKHMPIIKQRIQDQANSFSSTTTTTTTE